MGGYFFSSLVGIIYLFLNTETVCSRSLVGGVGERVAVLVLRAAAGVDVGVINNPRWCWWCVGAMVFCVSVDDGHGVGTVCWCFGTYWGVVFCYCT